MKIESNKVKIEFENNGEWNDITHDIKDIEFISNSEFDWNEFLKKPRFQVEFELDLEPIYGKLLLSDFFDFDFTPWGKICFWVWKFKRAITKQFNKLFRGGK